MAFWNLEVDANRVGLLMIERPEALNALNQAVLEELDHKIAEIAANPDIKVVVISGSGRAFVAGADIAAMSKMTPDAAAKFSALGQGVFGKLASLAKPSIAAINGFALGGGLELALACDLRIASDKAKLGQPEIGLGIVAGFGATQRLPRLIGVAKAKELLFTGATIGAADALAYGLVNSVVAHDEVVEAALQLAAKIAKQSAVTLASMKMAIDSGLEGNLADGLALEIQQFAACFATHDQKEGMSAFLEKREAKFQDR